MKNVQDLGSEGQLMDIHKYCMHRSLSFGSIIKHLYVTGWLRPSILAPSAYDALMWIHHAAFWSSFRAEHTVYLTNI